MMQDGKQKSSRTKVLLAVLVGLLLLVVAAGVFLMVSGRMKEKSYRESIQSAEKYLASNKYEDAIIAYKKAISVNPKDDEAYLGLAEAYLGQEDTSKAKSILKRGYAETNSVKIKLMLTRLTGQLIETDDLVDKAGSDSKPLDLTTASENIGWNTSLIQKAEVFRFEDYKDEFGLVETAKVGNDGYLEVVHSGFDGICYYRNTSDNKNIVDDSRKLPRTGSMPEKITFNSLERLFRNFEGGASLNRMQMLIGERIKPVKGENRYYIEATMDDLIIRIETDENGNIVSPNAWNEVILLNANKGSKKNGLLTGIVMDAVTGDGVKGATLTCRPEKSSLKTKTAQTDANGRFSVELDPGTYKITIEAEDYIDEEFEFEIEEGRTYSGEQFVISPELSKGSARIVLEWNAEPQDLDSYLFGETDKGASVNVRWSDKRATSGGDVIAELDLDDTNGYGPETITIHDLNGVYQYVVADFRRTQTMKQYGATVKVYLPGQAPVTITIDPGADVKDIWEVCEIDHGKLNIMNTAPAEDNFSPANK